MTLGRVEQALASYRFRERPDADPERWASVAAILRDDPADGPSVLVIRRSEHPSDPWSGHMAMPGGRKDPGDPTPRHAAEREALEEVGIDLCRHGRFLGRLDDVVAVARGLRIGLTIAPFVYVLEQSVEPVLKVDEVQEALWVPLRDLHGPTHRGTRSYEIAGTTVLLPCWRWNDRIIWGLTYNMLESLLRLAG